MNNTPNETIMQHTIPMILLAALLATGQSLTAAEPAKSPAASELPDPQRVYTEAEAIQMGWPMMAGPYSNYQPLRTATPIISDLSQAKKAWTTEGVRLGACKQGTGFGKALGSAKSAEAFLGPEAKVQPGGWAGLIVAEGKVFGASFRPAGDYVEVEFSDKTAGKVRVAAEDFVVAVDFHTGKKVWEAVEPGSMLCGGGKRAAHQVTPVYARGKVFAVGATGRVFAYNAATGQKLWQSDIGDKAKQAEAERINIMKSLASRRFAWPNAVQGHTALVAAENTLLVPKFAGAAFLGMDMETGKVLWEKGDLTWEHATPSIFRHSGREYILSANMKGEMMLLDPKDGKELWKVTGLGINAFTLAPSDKHVVVNVAHRTNLGESYGVFGAYRISPEKAELAWKLPDDRKYGFMLVMDRLATHQQTIRDGLFYFCGFDTKGGFIADVETGAIVHENLQGAGWQHWYLLGDKIIARVDSVHNNMGPQAWDLWSVKGRAYKQLPGQFKTGEVCGGYTVVQQTPVVAGRMFERTRTGEINCYDLRAAAK